MSGSCCNNTQLQLEVGKTYYGGLTNKTPIKIIRQWNTGIFEGATENHVAYLFTASGLALGYHGYDGTALPWSLIEKPIKTYEYKLIVEGGDGVGAIWFDFNSNIFIYTEDHYLIREVGKKETLFVCSGAEAKEFQQTLKV